MQVELCRIFTKPSDANERRWLMHFSLRPQPAQQITSPEGELVTESSCGTTAGASQTADGMGSEAESAFEAAPENCSAATAGGMSAASTAGSCVAALETAIYINEDQLDPATGRKLILLTQQYRDLTGEFHHPDYLKGK